MRTHLIFLLVVVIFFSCKRKEYNSRYVQIPLLGREESYVSNDFNEPFFMEDHFGYEVNFPGDSVKYVFTSEIIIKDGSNTYFLKDCTANKNGDNIVFEFKEGPSSTGWYAMKINAFKNNYNVNFHQTFSVTDSAYIQPLYKTIKQSILLDKSVYSENDIVKGKISLLISRLNLMRNITDTIKIYGVIKTELN